MLDVLLHFRRHTKKTHVHIFPCHGLSNEFLISPKINNRSVTGREVFPYRASRAVCKYHPIFTLLEGFYLFSTAALLMSLASHISLSPLLQMILSPSNS